MTRLFSFPSKTDWDYSSDALHSIMEPRVDPVPQSEFPDSLKPSDSFLGTQFASNISVTSQNHVSFLDPWSCHGVPPSFSYHPIPPCIRNQDAWNPLDLAAQAGTLSFQLQDSRHSNTQYSSFPEQVDKYNSVHSPGSTYSGKRNTASSTVTSFADSGYGSRSKPSEQEQSESPAALEQNRAKYTDKLVDPIEMQDPIELIDDPSAIPYPEMNCNYPGCNWTGKCPSDRRKHEARHKKQYKCDVKSCTRKEGFGTLNDLSRHKKCVHKQDPERGPKVLYLCFGKNCPRRSKRWPRLDNFRQHLIRMHSEENTDDLLEKSRAWYEKYVKPHQTTLSAADLLSQTEPAFQIQSEPDLENIIESSQPETCNSVVPSQTMLTTTTSSSENLTLNPIKIPDCRDPDSSSVQPTPPESSSVELPGLKSLNLPSSLDQRLPSKERNEKLDITTAAKNVVNAMMKSMYSNQRLRSHQWDFAGMERQGELSDRNNHMIRHILLAALNHLPDSCAKPHPELPSIAGRHDQEPIVEGKHLIQCEKCPAQTRLPCEMRKHQERHERSYGCTYLGCDKKFGSKSDWKRHENLHFRDQKWRCDMQDAEGRSCALLFTQSGGYANHLETAHNIQNTQIFLSSNRIGRQAQSQYWCGFCRKILTIRSEGKARLNERYDHIDFEHFKKGQRIDDWLPESGNLTKRQLREEAERLNINTSIANEGNGASSRPGGIQNDGMKQDSQLGDTAVNPPVEVFDPQPQPSRLRGEKRRKRKNTTPYSAGSQPNHSAGTGKKKRGRPPVGSRAAPSDQLPMTPSAIPLLAHDPQPRFQDYFYCCQCTQGPLFIENNPQCIFCPHLVCDNCKPGLPPADACVRSC